MGKKRTANKTEKVVSGDKRAVSKIPKKKLVSGVVFVEATYNNTKVLFAEPNGKLVMWCTSGVLGFNSAKKSTPYASAKVAEVIAEKAQAIGVKDIDIIIKGVGGGREAALRTFINRGFNVNSIKDKTPIPHNGPKRRKPRRV